jgi:hypothetical protein
VYGHRPAFMMTENQVPLTINRKVGEVADRTRMNRSSQSRSLPRRPRSSCCCSRRSRGTCGRSPRGTTRSASSRRRQGAGSAGPRSASQLAWLRAMGGSLCGTRTGSGTGRWPRTCTWTS